MLLLSATVAACSTQRPAGTETVTRAYKAAGMTYGSNSGALRVSYAMRLKRVENETALCGAVGHDGSAGLFTEAFLNEIRTRTVISHSGETLLYGVEKLPFYSEVNIKGARSDCLLTGNPWRMDFADTQRLEIKPPSRIQARF